MKNLEEFLARNKEIKKAAKLAPIKPPNRPIPVEEDLLQKRDESQLSLAPKTLPEEFESQQNPSKEFASITKRLKEDSAVQHSLLRYKEESEKLTWNFEPSLDEIVGFRVRHSQFLELFNTLTEEIKKFDFGNYVDYYNKCSDIKTFLVFQIQRIDQQAQTPEEDIWRSKADLRADLTPFVHLLDRKVL